MKFTLLVAAVAAQTADWTPCTKQDCSSAGWICCDVTKIDDATGQAVGTGTMICTDPNLRGIVPAAGGDYAGQTYHCTHEQHKDAAAGGASGAKTLAVSVLATAASLYMLA